MKAGVPLDEHARPRYEEAVDLLLAALGNERFSHSRRVLRRRRLAHRAVPERPFRVYLGGTSDRTYKLAAEHGWGVAVPPLLPYKALEQQLDLYRSSCAEHGNEPDIVWIHACHLDEDRDTALREGRDWVTGFIQGNCSPLTEYAEATRPTALIAAGYGFYAAGIMEQLAEVPYEQLIEEDYVWVGTPEDIVERIEETRGSVRVSGDRHHGQRGRCAALDGDQEPGAVRPRDARQSKADVTQRSGGAGGSLHR